MVKNQHCYTRPQILIPLIMLLLAFCQGQRLEQERRCRGSLQPSHPPSCRVLVVGRGSVLPQACYIVATLYMAFIWWPYF